MKILALDFEGTHKNPRQGCAIQLGVAVMDGAEVYASAEWLIKPPVHYKTGKPTREVDAYSLRVSGLDLDRIEAEGFPPEEACDALCNFVRTYGAEAMPVLAYNIAYDCEVYAQLLFDGGTFFRADYTFHPYPEILSCRWICAYRLARKKLSNALSTFSLDDVAGHFGLTRTNDKHGALEDAILAGRVHARLTASGPFVSVGGGHSAPNNMPLTELGGEYDPFEGE